MQIVDTLDKRMWSLKFLIDTVFVANERRYVPLVFGLLNLKRVLLMATVI